MNNNIIPIGVTNSGCNYHRIFLPYSELGFQVHENYQVRKGALYIINRKFPNHSTEQILAAGAQYVLDLDDYWDVPEDHVLKSGFVAHNTKEIVEFNIRHALAITVTNETLYKHVKPLNKEVHILPNALPFGKGQFTLPQTRATGMNFIYAGSFSHLGDIRIIANVVNNLDIDFYLSSKIPSSETWQAMRAEFRTNIGTINNRGVDSYMGIYNDKHVSLAPLEDNIFSWSKSNLKILEAGCKKLHIITSKILPYYNFLDRDYVDYADNQFEWYEKIKYCKNNPSYVEERASALHEHVKRHYSLNDVNVYRKELLEYVLSKKG